MIKDMVSIIVPIYNMEKYLHRCIQSILNQTYENFEIILVDDGSIDQSLKICNGYIGKDKRIHVIHQENQGQSAARNTGLREVKGEYIAFVDPDDYIAKNLLENAIDVLKQSNADMVAFGYRLVKGTKDAGAFERLYSEDSEQIKNACLYETGWEMWSKVYRSEIWKGVFFDPEIRSTTDLYINPEVIRNVKKAVSIPGIYYFWEREEHGSLVQTRKAKSYYWEYYDWTRYPKFVSIPKEYQNLYEARKHIGALRALCKDEKDHTLTGGQKNTLRKFIGEESADFSLANLSTLLSYYLLVKEYELAKLDDKKRSCPVNVVKNALKLYAVNSLSHSLKEKKFDFVIKIIRENQGVSLKWVYRLLRWGILTGQIWIVHIAGRLMIKKLSS